MTIQTMKETKEILKFKDAENQGKIKAENQGKTSMLKFPQLLWKLASEKSGRKNKWLIWKVVLVSFRDTTDTRECKYVCSRSNQVWPLN